MNYASCNVYTALSGNWRNVPTWDEIKHTRPWSDRAVVWVIFTALTLCRQI